MTSKPKLYITSYNEGLYILNEINQTQDKSRTILLDHKTNFCIAASQDSGLPFIEPIKGWKWP